MGVSNKVATLRLAPLTDGERCFAEWTAEFECEPARAEDLVERIGRGVFQPAFDELKKKFGRR